jgi:hypothetical protein
MSFPTPEKKWKDSLEKVVYDHNEIHDHLEEALSRVRSFLKLHKRILVGGMAIDFALRAKGDRLYGDDTIPDYDFYSPDHLRDAYSIAHELHIKGMPNLQAIVAMHQTTMRVRVDGETVADISYIPAEAYKQIDALSLVHDEIRYVHPHFQMIDQHRGLSMPLRDFPLQVVYARWKKDMERYNILSNAYPVEEGKEPLLTTITWEPHKKYCLLGYGALCYWITQARKKGFKGFDALTYDEKEHRFNIPVDPDHLWKLIAVDSPNLKPTHNPFLELIPARLIEKNVEWWLTHKTQISAKFVDQKYYVCNLQYCMMYFMYKFLFHGHTSWPYIVCQKLVAWASDAQYFEFCPNVDSVFGEDDQGEIYQNHRENFGNKVAVRKTPKNIYFDKFPIDVQFDPPIFDYEADIFNRTGDRV